MSIPPLPCDPQDLTPVWLTKALRQSSTIREGGVSEIAWSIIGEEWGFTGVVARIWLQYSSTACQGPATIVAKFPMARRETPSHYQQVGDRDATSRSRAYERAAREVLFYQQIGPHGCVPAPRPYYGAADAASHCIVLLLEDLARGDVGDVLEGCSSAQADSVLQAIAPFHALWWRDPRLSAFPWLPRWGQDIPARARRYGQNVEPFLARFGERIPKRAHDLVHGLVRAYTPLLSELADAPSTIIHGDLHLDNIIFGLPERDFPVWLIDWQGVMQGPGVLDLTLVNSVPVPVRREVETDLLAHYHATLVERGVTNYPMDVLRRHYHLALLADLAGMVNWLGTADLGSLVGRERAIVESIIEEPGLLTALLDHDVKSPL